MVLTTLDTMDIMDITVDPTDMNAVAAGAGAVAEPGAVAEVASTVGPLEATST